MASRIKQIYLDCNTILLSMTKMVSGKAVSIWSYINIYDNQIEEMMSGENYSFGTPACFVEFNPGDAKNGGLGITMYPDCVLTFHIIAQSLDGGGDTMEQNLDIYDLRDAVKLAFTNNKVSFCSALMSVVDKQDYKHNNIIKYSLSFKCNFIDNSSYVLFTKNPPVWGAISNGTINLGTYNEWISGYTYSVFNLVMYDGIIYMCVTGNSDTVFTISNWERMNTWLPNTSYSVGDFVLWNQNLYQCSIANKDVLFIISNWTLITT